MHASLKLIVLIVLCLFSLVNASGQVCPDPPPQTSGVHRFRQQGESFEIPITVAGCNAIALDLRWSNGRNNGSNFAVTFLDVDNQPIYTKVLFGFLSGTFQFPFASFDSEPWLGSRSMYSLPAKVTIQAVAPFAPPSAIAYTVTRASGRPRQKLDESIAMSLRTMPGKVLAQSSGRGAASESLAYKLEKVALAEPVEVESYGAQENIEKAFRLTLSGAALPAKFDLIWIDDAALPVLWRNGSQEAGTLIFDSSVLRDGAEMFVSNFDGPQMVTFAETLKLPDSLKNFIQPKTENQNTVVSISRGVRIIGVSRQPLVQIELKTGRPFPSRDSALQLQIGKRFFTNELSGDLSGRTLTLTLAPEMFAELKQGAEIVAFFNKPDRSGVSGRNIWYFGRLDKSMLRN